LKKKTQRKKSKKQSRTWQLQLHRLRKELKVRPMADLKREAIEKAVLAAKGDKTLAAALLGIGKTTIYRIT
jgi:transcriptional regulator of acetoin/glycerol metabolism